MFVAPAVFNFASSSFLVSSQIPISGFNFFCTQSGFELGSKWLPFVILQSYVFTALDSNDTVLNDGVATDVSVDQNILKFDAVDARTRPATNIRVVG